MSRMMGTDGRMAHALVDGSTLCGATVSRVFATRTPFPITQWATLSSFSGACVGCLDVLMSDPTVAALVGAKS